MRSLLLLLLLSCSPLWCWPESHQELSVSLSESSKPNLKLSEQLRLQTLRLQQNFKKQSLLRQQAENRLNELEQSLAESERISNERLLRMQESQRQSRLSLESLMESRLLNESLQRDVQKLRSVRVLWFLGGMAAGVTFDEGVRLIIRLTR